MNKVKELKLYSTLWPTPSKLVNLLDFKPDKISIKTESNTKNDIKVHKVRYDFDFSKNLGSLNILFVYNDQQNKYYQMWKEILKIINGGHGELKSCKEIRLFYDDLPIGYAFKIHSITIAIRSLIEKDNKFYPEISLNHCSYKIKA